MFIKKINALILLFFSSLCLSWVATVGINNPDLIAYQILVKGFSQLTVSIEPMLGIISWLSLCFSGLLATEPMMLFYFIYILLIQLFLYKGFYNLTSSFSFSYFNLVCWLMFYGTMHCLIQVRFGLANAFFLYLVSLLFRNASATKLAGVSMLAMTSHYSSLPSTLSVFLSKFKITLLSKANYFFVHIAVAGALFLVKTGWLLPLLPSFLYGRVVGYLANEQATNPLLIYISLIIYVLLLISPKSSNRQVNGLRMLGAVSFLPYFILPELEIFIRVGIPFQYLLLPYLLITWRSKKLFLTSTSPLIFFFGYKMYSNITAFMGYL